MKLEFVKAGEIVTTHGVKGEVKVLPWLDSPEDLCDFERCRISGKEYKELGGKTGVLVGLNLPSARGGTEAGVQSLQQGSCLSQRRNI